MAVVLYPEVPSIPEGLQQLLDDVSRACFQAEGIDEALFSVRIVDEETIHRLNRKTRKVDRPTDVLSYPEINYPAGKTARDCPRLLKREYDLWVAALEDAAGSREQKTDEEIAACIAGTLAQRQQLLKLLSTNHFDLEESCSVEALVDFKISYAKTLDAVAALLAKFRPDMDGTAVQEFQFTFFPFLFGVYPYTTLTDRQKETMERAGVRFAYYTVYDMIHRAVTKMLPARS